MENTYIKNINVQWADLDPNFHIRHSVYYDWAATTRIEYLYQLGIDAAVMQQHHFGPILFREEAIFKKEIRFGDKVQINLGLTKLRRDYSRWSWKHEIIKNNNILAAIVQVDGAFIDTQLRKLTAPPSFILSALEQTPRSADFQWEE